MLSFDIRSNAPAVFARLSDLQKKHLPRAQLEAAGATGRYIHAALRSEMGEVFDRPTPWTMGGLRFQQPSRSRPVVRIWLEEFGGKGIAAAQYLEAEIMGGPRKHKRFERALIAKGLMPAGTAAVPGGQAPLDAYGNVPGPFIVRMLSDLQAFGEQGYRANRRGARRGAKKTNYFFVPRPGSQLKPGVYWHMPNGLLGVVFRFVRSPSYRRRLDFYGVANRAYDRVAARFMTEAMARALRADNR
ncbi:hypothetical protein [Reyranella sp.]|uniref:hypothetical protein n=1 Tax=Reyranella sp. TaxID=1929291 RepID=UPI003D0B7434